jgi:hypothetical protein
MNIDNYHTTIEFIHDGADYVYVRYCKSDGDIKWETIESFNGRRLYTKEGSRKSSCPLGEELYNALSKTKLFLNL